LVFPTGTDLVSRPLTLKMQDWAVSHDHHPHPLHHLHTCVHCSMLPTVTAAAFF
jgi:hypothetical protein